jgi:uncharacterized cofD-like protein
MDDGAQIVRGEAAIDTHKIADPYVARIWLDGPARITSQADAALRRADAMLFGPGSLYTSILPILAVDGAGKALHASRGEMVAVANLVTQYHETNGWDVSDYLAKMEEYTDGKKFDRVIYNANPKGLPDNLAPVTFNREQLKRRHDRVAAIGTDLVDARHVAVDANDPLAATRSTVHHNPAAVAGVLREHVLPQLASV